MLSLSLGTSFAAFFAKTQEFYVVVKNHKIVFLRQNFFCFFYQLQLFFGKILIVNDFSAAKADKMMVVPFALTRSQLIPALAIGRSNLLNDSKPVKKFQSSVDGGQPDSRVIHIKSIVNFFGAQMLFGAAQNVQDNITGLSPAAYPFS